MFVLSLVWDPRHFTDVLKCSPQLSDVIMTSYIMVFLSLGFNSRGLNINLSREINPHLKYLKDYTSLFCSAYTGTYLSVKSCLTPDED